MIMLKGNIVVERLNRDQLTVSNRFPNISRVEYIFSTNLMGCFLKSAQSGCFTTCDDLGERYFCRESILFQRMLGSRREKFNLVSF